MTKANKGEWSEMYALLELMCSGKLSLCDDWLIELGETVDVLGGKMLPHTTFFVRDEDVQFDFLGTTRFKSKEALKELSVLTRDTILASSSTFEIPALEDFLSSVGGPKIKAEATVKQDCDLLIDSCYSAEPVQLDFSIKSELGGSPSLINAGITTNFIFKVDCEIEDYRDLKTKRLVKALNANGVGIRFSKMESCEFTRSLMNIDSRMPELVAHMVLKYFGSRGSSIAMLVRALEAENPLQFNEAGLYHSKIRDLLMNSALGMVPSIIWDPIDALRGGCIVVKKRGDVVGFYFLKNNQIKQFGDYLMNVCFLDTASTTRHKFGRLIEEDEGVYLNLNLNIRMKQT